MQVGAKPDVDAMSKDDLAALCKQLYERACGVFGEKFDSEYQVKKRDMEIHTLEMETSESHGTFKIPKLKKVNLFIIWNNQSLNLFFTGKQIQNDVRGGREVKK